MDVQDTNHRTPLHEASSESEVEAAEFLLEYGASVHMRNNQGRTPLHLASWHGRCDMMRLLLERGADVNAQSKSRSTPLHEIIQPWGSMDGVQLLLDHGANPNVRDERGRTPLQLASRARDKRTKRLLLDYVPRHRKSSIYSSFLRVLKR